MTLRSLHLKRGFTIIELLVVIVVIGILATVVIVAYNGIQKSARDNAVLSDLDGVNSELTRYTASHNGELGTAVVWYSGAGQNPNIEFTPSSDNIVDIVADTSSYCIRVYNPGSNKSNIFSAITKGFPATACDLLSPSDQAIANSPTFSGWLAITSGSISSCGIAGDRNAYCWGQGTYGNLGQNSTGTSSSPVAVVNSGALSGKKISKLPDQMGSYSSCAIASDSLPYCWGYNADGQLGNNSLTQSNVPVAVDTSGVLAGKTVKSMTIGGSHACVVASDDLAYCWGDGANGKLGNGLTADSPVPVAFAMTGVLAGKTVKAIAAGLQHTCLIASDDLAYCLGLGTYGQLGFGAGSSVNPVAVNRSTVLAGKTMKSLTAGDRHTCAVASDNQAYCWGQNTYAQLGNNSTSSPTYAVAVNTAGVLAGKSVSMISTTSFSPSQQATCVVASGDVSCWGANLYGQVGNNTTSQYLVPTSPTMSGVLNGKKIRSVSEGQSFTCVVTTDNKGSCWGSNTSGRLGNGSTTSSLVPVNVNLPF